MEINSVKNHLFDALYDVANLSASCFYSVDNEASLFFVVHYVGTSLRFDSLSFSLPSALSDARRKSRCCPNMEFRVLKITLMSLLECRLVCQDNVVSFF